MYIRNLADNPDILLRSYMCNSFVNSYLQEKGLPILGKLGSQFVYAETDVLLEILEYMPLWLKVLSKF
jgi:hypothetical protein